MPFGRLSPVSETDDESSIRTASIDLKPRPLNFSRPKPQDIPSARNISREANYADSTSSSSSVAGGSSRGVGAFYEPPPINRDLPDEPRFSLESDRSYTASTHSSGSELVWDHDAGELRSKRLVAARRGSYDAQRSTAPRRPPHKRSNTSGSTTTTKPGQSFIAELPGDAPSPHMVAQQRQQQKASQQKQAQQPTTLPEATPKIVKRTSFDQQSERLSTSSSIGDASRNASTSNGGGGNGVPVGWEDTASRQTTNTSENSGGRNNSTDSPGEFKSSTFDISELGEKKIAKLKKKGINPQLYMEMQAARGGKGKLVGPLVGNTYIG